MAVCIFNKQKSNRFCVQIEEAGEIVISILVIKLLPETRIIICVNTEKEMAPLHLTSIDTCNIVIKLRFKTLSKKTKEHQAILRGIPRSQVAESPQWLGKDLSERPTPSSVTPPSSEDVCFPL